METRFPAIQDLTTPRVRNVVRRALRTGLDAEMLGDFLASVDWSGYESADSQVKAMLGEMEAWSTAYTERQLTRAQYVARLLSLLPRASERSRRLVMGGGSIALTVAGRVERPQPDEAQPRSEPGVQYLRAIA